MEIQVNYTVHVSDESEFWEDFAGCCEVLQDAMHVTKYDEDGIPCEVWDSEEDKYYQVTAGDIISAVSKFLTGAYDCDWLLVSARKCVEVNHRAHLEPWITFDFGGVDGIVIDMILQLAVFGDVIYG